jgi:hypothetical protein
MFIKIINKGIIVNYRKTASLICGLSFVILTISGIPLYIKPHGYASKSDWTFWGGDKWQWADIHTNFGVLFCLFGALHIYYNFKAIKAYLKKSKKVVIFTKEFNYALIITIVFILFTVYKIPPISFIQDYQDYYKAESEKELQSTKKESQTYRRRQKGRRNNRQYNYE